jgi:hypothetical protein
VSDTPRTEAEVNRQKCWSDDLVTIDANFACQLERELNAANQRIELLTACNADVARIAKERNDALDRIKRLEEFVEQLTNPKFTRDDLPKEALLQRIKRLEEAGDEMARWLSSPRNIGGDRLMAAEWDKAKEAKP